MKNVSNRFYLVSRSWSLTSYQGHQRVTVLSLQVNCTFKHSLLIKSTQKRITWCSACNKSHRSTPAKAPIQMKAIARQQQLFKSSPPCQPRFAPQQECVCVPTAAPPERWLSPGSARLYVCQAEEYPSPTTAAELPAGPMKSLFDSSLDRLGSLGVQPASYQPSLHDHVSRCKCYTHDALSTLLGFVVCI